MKRTSLRIGLCVVLGLTAPCAAQTDAAKRCWSPDALAARPGEKSIRRTPYNPRIEPPAMAESAGPPPVKVRGSIRSVKLPAGEKKLIALTFDLCENAGEVSGYDGDIIDTLRRLNVKATFFASGKWLLDHSERAQQLLADPRFEVGAHSWTHRNFRLMSSEDVREDLALDLGADAAMRHSLLAKACFSPTSEQERALRHATVFRFPFGTCNAQSLAAVNDAGLFAIQWSVVSGDPARSQSAEAIRHGVVGNAKPGAIVVMHANGRGWHTAEALPYIIDDLKAGGFEFATVSELLEKGKPETVDSCYELKPGDNARYDKLFPLEPLPGRGAAANSAPKDN